MTQREKKRIAYVYRKRKVYNKDKLHFIFWFSIILIFSGLHKDNLVRLTGVSIFSEEIWRSTKLRRNKSRTMI